MTDETGAESAPVMSEDEVRERITAAMRTIYDPEIPVNIYELGLIYGIKREASGEWVIEMTLTSPNCPEAQSLPVMVQHKARAASGGEVRVELVWSPPWAPHMMTDEARLALNMM